MNKSISFLPNCEALHRNLRQLLHWLWASTAYGHADLRPMLSPSSGKMLLTITIFLLSTVPHSLCAQALKNPDSVITGLFGTKSWHNMAYGWQVYVNTDITTSKSIITYKGPDGIRRELIMNLNVGYAPGNKGYYQYSIILQGLLPRTRYRYQIQVDDHLTKWYSFTTPSKEESFTPSNVPDRVVLSWTDDPATSFAVTWRTDTSVNEGLAQIIEASKLKERREIERTHTADKELADVYDLQSHHYSHTFQGLESETTYAYRVGDGQVWSEWFHYTTASTENKPFSFIYFGDSQNNLKSFWSRIIRQAFMDNPRARFILHAGDLINIPEADHEWGEWFYAGGFIHSMVPVIATPGNHEYTIAESGMSLDRYWNKHFSFPENGPTGQNLSETCYYVDCQGMRISSLNAMELWKRNDPDSYQIQKEWLEKVLRDNHNRWTVVTLHIPVFGAIRGDSEILKAHFKPLFDAYGVDLVLQGHDHVYGRGMAPINQVKGRRVKPSAAGPVYVVSVSGPKMYRYPEEGPKDWISRSGEGMQLYQIIHVSADKIRYEAFDPQGELYDAFELVKKKNGTKKIIDLKPSGPDVRIKE